MWKKITPFMDSVRDMIEMLVLGMIFVVVLTGIVWVPVLIVLWGMDSFGC